MHTKEPWRVSGTNHLVGANGKVIPYDEFKEDARRIVACVNACAGIPTAHLENCGLALFNHYVTVEDMKFAQQQRDELLAALKLARAELDKLPRSLGYDFDHIPAIDAAIAKCEA